MYNLVLFSLPQYTRTLSQNKRISQVQLISHKTTNQLFSRSIHFRIQHNTLSNKRLGSTLVCSQPMQTITRSKPCQSLNETINHPLRLFEGLVKLTMQPNLNPGNVKTLSIQGDWNTCDRCYTLEELGSFITPPRADFCCCFVL